ncbi:YcxB family protein [Thalassotalea sp. PS06]|uniref:YcxB family protein n=1 Tax=Thalassotalea sp. PS06 TaxID=2594005 RepID=UPI001163A1A5|nr:YcxB family protein [Thalassotalea sp. PS06]QDP02428.1 YcxB family protein [Thalassotalea sp. PS06]
MSEKQEFTVSFELDKKYLGECFEQSRIEVKQSFLQKYAKAFILLMIAGLIIQLNVEGMSKHLGAFFIILAVIEILSQIYARGWWVTRQMLSRNYGHQIEMTMSQESISWQGGKQTLSYQWSQIKAHQQTPLGLVLTTDDGARHYFSKSHFEDDSWQFLLQHLPLS